ncbi:MAG TPA: right-handed parallel beta-helix repeat-containing protein [Actinomycetes bacterium]|nr:right-handed parallel beta-helix repeat-containing protein [Actinomycetes bacterium]
MQALLAAWLAAAVALGVPAPAGDPTWSDNPRTLHVAANAAAPGDGSMARPYPRIAQAVAAAVAGDTVLVGPGRYAEEVRTARPGRPKAPIRILGRPGAHLVGPRGLARGRLVQILHDHVTLQSLELSDANILVWVQGARGVRLLGNRLHDAGGECVRLKGDAQANEIASNVIAHCGRVRFDLARGAKNGEAIYIGTAPEQSGGQPDRSNGNRVHHNRIAATAECVDVKEAALRNLVERNRCSGSDDPDGAGLSSRGDHTTFRYNLSTRHAGAGIRLGGDQKTQGVRNNVVGNTLTDNAGYGLKVMRRPQGRIAGNTFARNRRGRTNQMA